MSDSTAETTRYTLQDAEILERLLEDQDPSMTIAETRAAIRADQLAYWQETAIDNWTAAERLAWRVAELEGYEPKTPDFSQRLIALYDAARNDTIEDGSRAMDPDYTEEQHATAMAGAA